MLNFGQKVEEQSGDTIPKDAILWCVLNVREIKVSRETQGQYLDIELTVADNQPYARRKIWDKIAHPFDNNNSEKWRSAGYGAIRRILEATKGATPDNQNSYVLNQLTDLSGLTVPVLVGIEKGNDDYPDDKNKAEYLSPHSTVKKIAECYRLLCAGQYQYNKPGKAGTPPGVPAQGSMFNGTAQQPPAQFAPQAAPVPQAAPAAPAPTWLAPGPASPAPAYAQAQQAGNFAPPATAPSQPPVSTQASTAPQYNPGPAAQNAAYPSNPPQQYVQAPAPAFQPGQAPAPQQQYVNPAVPQQPAMTNMAPAVQPATTYPSNGGLPAQFPMTPPQG